MKTRTISEALFYILLPLFFILPSCNMEEENTPPTCEILLPIDGQDIYQGSTVNVSIGAVDSDGTITEVSFMIDGVIIDPQVNPPYVVSWNTANETLGSHTLRATCTDNSGETASAEIVVTIIESGPITGTFTDARDGQVYTTVVIGNLTWMTQNLNYASPNSWWYNNDVTNGNTYGRLYTYDDALVVSPNGWHLPTDDEWKSLEIALGMAPSSADGMEWRGVDEGEKMKTTYGWPTNGNGTNSSGFSALPGGTRTESGNFNNVGGNGYWWTATAYNSGNSWYRMLNNTKRVWREYRPPSSAISVRCVKDN